MITIKSKRSYAPLIYTRMSIAYIIYILSLE